MNDALGYFCCRKLFGLTVSILIFLQLAASASVPGLDVFINEGEAKGPTVLVTIGLDGNRDDYAPRLAEEFAHWPVVSGKFIFAVVNDAARETGDKDVTLTRAFPVKDKRAEPVGETAAAIWKLASEADYVLDLRQAAGVRQTNSRSYGQTIVVVRSIEAIETAHSIAHAMSYSIADPDLHWLRVRGGPINMLARASHEHFGAESMTLYFSRKALAPNERARQAQLGIYRLLDRLRMIETESAVFTELNPKPRVPDYRAMHPGKRIVGVFMANGAGERGISASIASFAGVDDVEAVRFTSEEVRDGILAQFDAVIFPGGSGGGQARALGDEGRAKVSEFVSNGGGYIGICAGAYLALSGQSYGLDLINAKTVSSKWRRGQKILPVELSESGSSWFPGDSTVNIRYNQGPIFEPDDHPSLPPYEVLAYYRDEVAKNNTPVGIQKDSPAIATAMCGEGRVVIIGPHPESTPDAELGYFLTESAARMFGGE